MTGILPQPPAAAAPSEREPRTRDTDSSACGLRMTGERGNVVVLCVRRDDSARLLSPSLRELSPKVTEGVSQGVETRETLSKPISFSLLEKETVFGIQRKRGF